jgi:hypothetical protein
VQFPPDDSTPLANLQLTMLEKLGLDVEKFGDSDGMLTGI